MQPDPSTQTRRAATRARGQAFGNTPMEQLAQRLYVLRYVAVFGQAFTVALVEWGLEIPLPLVPMAGVLLLELGFNLWVRARSHGRQSPDPGELTACLGFDMAVLSALLYMSGGWGNPFVSLLLLPVIIAATALPAMHSWLLAALAIAAYSLLANRYVPLEVHEVRGFHLHVLGMWFNFAVSVLLVATFVTRLRRAVAERDARLAQAREEALRNERLIAVGLVAAGAAHELATPLNTIALACDAMQGDGEDWALVREQISRCKGILGRLTRTAADENPRLIAARADEYLNGLVEDWRLMRPQVIARVIWDGVAPDLRADATLGQALINLFNNAANASPRGVQINGSVDRDMLRVDIADQGPGLSLDAIEKLGAMQASSTGGLGLGLFLTNATIERLGGRVALSNRAEGGARVTVHLPLERLNVE